MLYNAKKYFEIRVNVSCIFYRNVISVVYYLDLIYQTDLLWRINYSFGECSAGLFGSRPGQRESRSSASADPVLSDLEITSWP